MRHRAININYGDDMVKSSRYERLKAWSKRHPYATGFIAGYKLWFTLGLVLQPLVVWMYKEISAVIGIWLKILITLMIVPYVFYIGRFYYRKHKKE